jgi:hypothetical protein
MRSCHGSRIDCASVTGEAVGMLYFRFEINRMKEEQSMLNLYCSSARIEYAVQINVECAKVGLLGRFSRLEARDPELLGDTSKGKHCQCQRRQ